MKPNPANTSPRTTRSTISVALVEDQKDLCDSWVRIIEAFGGFACTCTCGSAEEAVRSIPEARPDVILMDIRLPRMSGIECTSQLKEILPTTPIVILTVLDDDELIFRALEAGADGYLLKRSKPADLCTALRAGWCVRSAARLPIHAMKRICPHAKSKCWVYCPEDSPTKKLPTRCV